MAKLGTGSQSMVAIARVLALLVMFVACTFLFYQQAIGAYPSDLPLHLRPLNADIYSVVRVALVFLLEHFGHIGPAVFLALIEVATIIVTEYLIRKLAPNIKPGAALALAIACNLVIAIYIRFIYRPFTVGSPSANRWHNSTYTAMRLFAMLAIVYYLKFDGQIKARSRALSWILFTLMLILATSAKPSFVVAFGPAMFVFCVIDLVRNGKKTVPKSLLVGLSLAITLAVVLYQLVVLFPGDGSSGDNHIAVGFAVFWSSRNPHVLINCFQVLAFPALAAIATRPMWRTDRNYLLAVLVFAFAFMENLLLYEDGSRMMHGNFGWGLCFALFYLFIVSVIAFVNTSGRDWGLVVDEPGASPVGLVATAPDAEAGEHPVAAAGADNVPSAGGDGAPSAGGDGVPDAAAIAAEGSGAVVAGAGAKPRKRPIDIACAVAFFLHTASGVLYFVLLLFGHAY